MCALHQAHKLPWSCLTNHLTPTSRIYTPMPFANIIFGPTKQVSQSELEAKLGEIKRDVYHFARVLCGTIREFSETERNKIERIGEEYSHIASADYFSFQWDACPDLMAHSELYHGYSWRNRNILDENERAKEEHRMFEQWRDREGDSLKEDEYWKGWGEEHIEHLINLDTEESLVTLQRLATEGKTVLKELRNGLYVDFGWSVIGAQALGLYIFLNVLISMDMHTKGIEYLRGLQGVDRFIQDLTCSGCEYNIHDRIFFSKWKADIETLDILQEHLKKLFRRMYLYDWLCGLLGVEAD